MLRIKKNEGRNKKDNMAKWVLGYPIILLSYPHQISWLLHNEISSQKVSELNTGNQALIEKLLGLEKRHSTGSEQQVSRK